MLTAHRENSEPPHMAHVYHRACRSKYSDYFSFQGLFPDPLKLLVYRMGVFLVAPRRESTEGGQRLEGLSVGHRLPVLLFTVAGVQGLRPPHLLQMSPEHKETLLLLGGGLKMRSLHSLLSHPQVPLTLSHSFRLLPAGLTVWEGAQTAKGRSGSGLAWLHVTSH